MAVNIFCIILRNRKVAHNYCLLQWICNLWQHSIDLLGSCWYQILKFFCTKMCINIISNCRNLCSSHFDSLLLPTVLYLWTAGYIIRKFSCTIFGWCFSILTTNNIFPGVLPEWREMPIGKLERPMGIHARRNSNDIGRRIQSEER